MKNIHEQIEALYTSSSNHDSEALEAIILELKEIKNLLKASSIVKEPKARIKRDKVYYAFVKSFRKLLKADTIKDIYPEVIFKGKRLGANFDGLLYYKSTGRLLSTKNAFEVYDYFYAQDEPIETFLIKN